MGKLNKQDRHKIVRPELRDALAKGPYRPRYPSARSKRGG